MGENRIQGGGYVVSIFQVLGISTFAMASSAFLTAFFSYRSTLKKLQEEVGIEAGKILRRTIPLALQALGISSSMVGSIGVFLYVVLPYACGMEIKTELNLGTIDQTKTLFKYGQSMYKAAYQEFQSRVKDEKQVNR